MFQGTLGTLAHVWYYRGVQTLGPSVTAIFMHLQPLAGLLLAALVLGERVSPGPGARRRDDPDRSLDDDPPPGMSRACIRWRAMGILNR